jgi:DNA-binding NarL/FixJ family response regulator
MAIRIVIVDDHPLIVASVRDVLEQAGDFDVVGTCHDAAEILPLVARTTPDVLLLDMRMSGLDGITCIERVRARHPQIKIVVLSAYSSPEQVQAALARGADGYIVKTIGETDLAAAIRAAVEGTAFFAVSAPMPSEFARAAGLTERELTIVKAVARGLPNQGIAKELWVTEQTVKFHLTNIYRKLGVANRTEATRWALAHGYADSPVDAR